MLMFEYIARDPTTGKKVKAQVEADNEQAASKLIRKNGLSPLDIKAVGAKSRFKLFSGVKSKDKVLLSRQLATLINAGLPLVQSLRSVTSQTSSKPLKVVMNQIISDVEAGSPLSVAMGKHPDVFNQVYVSLIAAGETSGTLDKSLERLAIQQEKDAEILSKVRGAMVYPIIVLLVMFAVVGFMIVKVLPQVGELYKDLPGASLPLITRILLAVSHFIIKFWWVVILLVAVLSVLGSRWFRSVGGKRVADKLKLEAWPIAPLMKKLYMARFTRTAATLAASGVSLLQVLDTTARAVNNIYIEEAIRRAAEKVKGGKALSDALEKEAVFLELVPNMLHIGEQSGAIEKMLEKTADYYEREVDDQIKTVSTIIEPLLMVILGVFAFIIVAAVLLPIYGLAGSNALTRGL